MRLPLPVLTFAVFNLASTATAQELTLSISAGDPEQTRVAKHFAEAMRQRGRRAGLRVVAAASQLESLKQGDCAYFCAL